VRRRQRPPDQPLEVQENAVDFAGRPNKKFTLFVCDQSTWVKKWQDRYQAHAAKRAERTDDYLNKPPSTTHWTLFKPLEKYPVLAESVTRNIARDSDFLDKDLNEIQLIINRGRDKIACRVGGVVFYPIIGKLRGFTRCVYFRYENLASEAQCDTPNTSLFLAMPLDLRGCLLTGEVFSSFTPAGIGWVVYPGDKALVGHWLAQEIHPSVRFTDVRGLNIRPLPAVADPMDSPISLLREKTQTARQAHLVSLDQSKYLNKVLNEIPLMIPKNKVLLVGKCRFWAPIPNFVCTRIKTVKLLDEPPDEIPLSYSGSVALALRTDDAGLPFTNAIWAWGPICRSNTWGEYSGDRRRILLLIARKIHPSVKISEIRSPQPWAWTPLPEPSDSYKCHLARKCEKARKVGWIQLAKEKYAKKHLHEIQLELTTPEGSCSCKVGNLVFYPISNGQYVIVRGENLFPQFESLWFGFKLARNFMDTKTIYGSTDNGWKPYAPGNAAHHSAILRLIQHAIVHTAAPAISQEEWTEMAAAYPINSDFSARWAAAHNGIPLHSPTEQLQSLLELLIPLEKKITRIRTFFDGSLYPVDWDTLTPLLKHPLLADKKEWIIEAKKKTFVAVAGTDPAYEAQMLRDPEIERYSHSPEFAEARADPWHARDSLFTPPE
jgi:hypothetical protein